jgi:dTDP-4-amino-4,6-dideoxygalactose transaminase
MKIPLVDLKAQYLTIKDEIDGAIRRVIESSTFILGEEVTAFEHEFAAYCGVEYAVGTSSGTTAVHTALTALGIGPGDEVMTTPMTFIATTAEITHTGAVPVFVDIEPESFTLDVERAREKIEADYYFDDQGGVLTHRLTQRRLKAIMPVHLYGQMADVDPCLRLASQYNLKLIEDAAQAVGAEYHGADGQYTRAGSLGQAACFSFYPAKNLGAYGDAGAAVTSDPELARSMRLFIDQGRIDKYTHLFEGRNYRLDTLQAAILRAKLPHLNQWNESRRRIARLYDEMLRDVAEIRTPNVMEYGKPVYHLYVIRTARRDELFRTLNQTGVGVGVHYPLPLHLQPAYRYLNYKPGDFPVAEACAREVLSLPIYPELTDEQVEFIVETIKELA